MEKDKCLAEQNEYNIMIELMNIYLIMWL